MQAKSRRKFLVTPQIIQFQSSVQIQKFIVKNTSLRVESFEVINPNQDHYKIESGRKFTLAPGMSNVCSISHITCNKCYKNEFNQLRVASSQKQSILLNMECPKISEKQLNLIQCDKTIDFGEFNLNSQRNLSIPIKNLTNNNLKIIISFSSNQSQAFKLELEQTQIILLKQRQTVLKGSLNFITGSQFVITLLISVTSQENLSEPAKIQKIIITGNALVRNQVVKDQNGKVIDVSNLKVLNGAIATGQFFIENCFRKDCYFKIIPEIHSSNPNEFSQKWAESQIIFSQSLGQIKAFQSRKITYEIKTTPNIDDINFTQKFSKIDYHDDINISKMKTSKFFRKNVEINVKTIFIEKQDKKQQNSTNFKIKLNIVNPALKIKNKIHQNKLVFQIHNQTELNIPYEIQNNTLYKSFPQKGVLKHEKQLIEIQWKKNTRPFSGTKTEMMRSTFSLVYGKCNIFLKLPSHDLQIYNFVERENLRPSSSTIKHNLGLQKSQSMMLKRPLSALCSEMVAKKLHLVEEKDFYKEIPRFLPIQKLKNEELEKLVISSGEKGNIISNTWNKQIAAYFAGKGYLILKPLKTYLLPYSLQLSTLSINEQQFQLEHRYTSTQASSIMPKNIILSQSTYTLSSKELSFAFNVSKKQYFVEKCLGITNCSRQMIKAFLLTVEDEYFVSGEDGSKLIIQPNETANFRIRLYPTTPYKKQTKITRTIQFLINGIKQQITCYGQLLPVDCEHYPEELHFTDCHYGEQETQQKIVLTNCGFNKFSYEIQCSRYVSVNYLENSGTIPGKGHVEIGVKFRPNVYLQNFKDCIKILIRGSHTIVVPLLIKTKKPNVAIIEKKIDFGEGILGDTVQGSMTILNKNNSSIECKIDLNQTDLSLENNLLGTVVSLQSNEKKSVNFYVKIKEIGTVNNKLSKPIVSISGYGPIQSPMSFTYVGKQNIMQISPSGTNHIIDVEEIQSSYVIKFTSLIGHKIELKAELTPQKKFDQTFILSVEPQLIQILPYSEKQILINCLIADLEKLKEIERNYQLKIFRKGFIKPYTVLKIKVKLPTPKLIISPNELYFPIIGLNQWNHRMFKIENKGYKQIHFKIKKPSNIPFELEAVPKFYSNITTNSSENKLTKLNNEAEIRVSFRSKNVISFQNIIEIEDNFGNLYTVKFFGMTTNCPLLLSENLGSMPLSAKSIQSMVSMPLVRTVTTISGASIKDLDNMENETDNVKFLNFWIGSLMPHMKKDYTFNQYLSKPQALLEFLSYFSIDLPKSTTEKQKLSQILFQLRKLDIPLDIINIEQLSKNTLSEWIKFMYIFLSKRLVHPECLKWLSKTAGQTIDNYEVAYGSYKKILTNVLNSLFFRVFKVKIVDYERIVERLDPYLEFLFKIENRKHLIISLNLLYYKFSNEESEFIKSQELSHRLSVAHSIKYERTINWIISDASPEVLINTNGVNPHTNISSFGYYFSLDKTHPQTEVVLSLKQSCCIAVLNSTLFEKCHFVEYELLQVQPKIHSVTIQCEDKFTQEWNLEYNAPVDSQYKVEFIGSPQFKCKFNVLGLIKVGKKIPISVTYSPTNLNLHQATLTIMNKHFKEIYNIRGKPLFSRNVEYERFIKVCQGKKHIEVIEIPWQYNQHSSQRKNKDKLQEHKKDSKPLEPQLPTLTLTQYNEKRKQFISHKLTVMKQGKKDFIVKIKIQYEFGEIFKSLPLSYQIMNEDKTQSKIIRLFIKVIPKPINIEAQVRCKLEQSVTEKIPIQNLSEQKQLVVVQFFKSLQQLERFDKIQSKGSMQYSDRSNPYENKSIISKNDNQFRLSRTGRLHLQPGQLENITLKYFPDSLFEAFCVVRITYDSSESVINYKFKGIPEFPSTMNQQIFIKCKVEEKKTFKIHLKSLVRQNTTFDVETNIKELIGKDRITLASGQTLQYPVQILSHHSGTLSGEVIFKSPEVTLVYPLEITVQQNLQLIQKYEVTAKVRQSMTLQLQLLNKSNQNITYEVFWDHEYLSCPERFYIEKNSKKHLQVNYLPYSVGKFLTKVKLYHPDLKEIVYELKMTSFQHEEIISGSDIELMDPYVFVLPVKNNTPKDCLIQKPTLSECLKLKTEEIQFPFSLSAGKSLKIELLYSPKKLTNRFEERIALKTDCIGDYNFVCHLNILETKSMTSIDILYKSQKSVQKIDSPFSAKFINEFNERLQFHVEYKGSQTKMFDSFKLKTPVDFTMEPFETSEIQGEIKINLEKNKSQKSLLNITSNEDLQSPMQMILSTIKDRVRYQFIYAIKLIRLYENPEPIVIKSNAYEMKKTPVDLAVVKEVAKWKVSDFSEEFIKNSFGFISPHHHQNYLETVINKPLKYDGHITFYNLKNQAQRIPLRLQIGEPKYEPVVISSNVGQKAILQIQLKNGQGPFKCELTNNKTEQFAVEPIQGKFVQEKGELVAKINFIYFPNEYSGIKRAKVAITSEHGCYYFNLMGKFKSIKK